MRKSCQELGYLGPSLTQKATRYTLLSHFDASTGCIRISLVFLQRGLGFTGVGLRSVGFPPQASGCHTICVQVCFEFLMVKIALWGVTYFTGIHFSLGSLHALIA